MRRHRLAAAVALAATVLAGCGPSQDELVERAVQDAAAALAAEPFAFELGLEAAQDGLDALGDALGAIGPILASGAVSGVADGPRLSLTLSLLGLDVLEVRSLGEEELFVRLDLGRFAALTAGAGGFDAAAADSIAAQLRAAGVEDAVSDAIVASVEGGWIAVVGERPTTEADGSAALGRALAGVLRAAQVTRSFGELDEDVPAEALLDVSLAPRAALDAVLGALVGLDSLTAVDDGERLPGSVLLADGRLRTVTIDLAQPVGELIEQDVAAGAYVLRLDVVAPDRVVSVEAPEVVSRLTIAQLERAVALLAGAGAP